MYGYHVKPSLIKQLMKLEKEDPEGIYRISYCKDADEVILQVWYKKYNGWMCLHDE